MKKTLSLSAALLMSTTPVFAQDAILLDEIVVNATLAPTEAWKSATTVASVSSEDMSRATSSALTNSLAQLGSFSKTQPGGMGSVASVSLRGMTGEYIAVTRDGIDVTDPSGTKTAFQYFGSLTSNSISSIQVLKGAQSALYGSSAIAGVVSMNTLDLDAAKDGMHHNVDLGFGTNQTIAGSYKFTHSSDRLSLGLAASSYRTDGISAASTHSVDHSTGNKNSERDGFESTSISVAAKYALTDTITVGATAFQDDMKNDFDEWFTDENGTPFDWSDDINGPIDGSPDERATAKSTGGRVYADMNVGNWNHVVALSQLTTERKSISPDVKGPDSEPYSTGFKGERESLSYVATGKIAQNLTVTLGADTKRETSSGDAVIDGSKSVTTNGVFAEVQYQPTENWSILANVRQDDHSLFGTFQSYRLNTAYKLTDTTVIRGSVSQSYRSPSLSELYGDYPGEYPTIGNPKLKPETSKSFEYGLDQYFQGGAVASFVFYETEIRDRIEWSWGFPQSTYDNLAFARARGAEMSFTAPVGDNTKLKLAFANNTMVDLSGKRIGRAAGQTTSVTVSHDFSDKLSGTVNLLSASDHASAATDDYTLLNVSANYQITDTLSMYANVENLNDVQYQTEADYSSPGRTIFAGIRASF